jgi:hypothetical protein
VKLLPELKARKIGILEALSRPDSLLPLPRGLGGYATPPGVPPLPLAGCVMAQQIQCMPEGDSVPRDGMADTSEFAARLSAEDLEDIAAGDIPLGTIQALEQAAIAREAEDLREHFEERASILRFDAGLPKPDAEIEAGRITASLAHCRGFHVAGAASSHQPREVGAHAVAHRILPRPSGCATGHPSPVENP